MYWRPETVVAAPAAMKSAVQSSCGTASGHTKPTSTTVTDASWKNVVALPMTLGRTAMRSPLTTKSVK